MHVSRFAICLRIVCLLTRPCRWLSSCCKAQVSFGKGMVSLAPSTRAQGSWFPLGWPLRAREGRGARRGGRGWGSVSILILKRLDTLGIIHSAMAEGATGNWRDCLIRMTQKLISQRARSILTNFWGQSGQEVTEKDCDFTMSYCTVNSRTVPVC